MTDAEILEIIADGIVDGTDMDCTPADQARAVLKALRDAGVVIGKVKLLEFAASPWSTGEVYFCDVETVFGVFGYGRDRDGRCYASIPGRDGYIECGTDPDTAEALAQADYEARIRAALEAPQ
jgi:hypothetical protein